jgi:NADPH:quinone reductase-like Zn-dependent oxidoreductase
MISRGEKMKAILANKYGPPEVLEFLEIEKPEPKDNEILIRVHAAAVNPLDKQRGKPYILRLMTGLRKPKNSRLGVDLAGVVEAVGKDVTEFKAGDEVFGARNGAFAEYVVTQGKGIALKPANLSFEQAAAVPVAAFTALQGLRDKGNIQAGDKVLINGASGGVGTFAVQIARAFGGEVTAVCSTRNVDLVRSLGADRVLDYTREDYTQEEKQYDLIFDSVGNHSLSATRRILRPQGTYVMVGGPIPKLLRVILTSRLMKPKMVFFIAAVNKADLLVMKELIEAGKVTPVIDRRYTLEQVPDAIRYLTEGHARGKIIINIFAGDQ